MSPAREVRRGGPPELAVVIPCKDDPKVVECVASVPDRFAVMLVFNGCAPGFADHVLGRIRRPNLLVLDLAEANLSLALEAGVRASPCDHVLLMDADCVFAPGAVEAAAAALAEPRQASAVFKGLIVFAEDGSLQSRLVARSRQHHTAEQLTAYKPPLALDRRLAASLGGYLFDWRLRWREDADLDHRIRVVGIRIVRLEGCTIFHEPLSIASDLRSTFRYGVGEALARTLGKPLTDVPRSVVSTLRSQGAAAALYMLLRNRVYTAGYLWARLTVARRGRALCGEDPALAKPGS